MTNEEIDGHVQIFRLLAEDLGFSIPESALTHFAYELVSQAYEEAAQRCEAHQRLCTNDDPSYCPEQIAQEIRAWKNELVQEPVSST